MTLDIPRILEEYGEVRERRNQRRHPNYTKPELLAEAPNQVWSWDITKLRGPVKWTYYYLYVILDIFSRYVVLFFTLNREDFSFVIHLDRQPRTSRRREAQTGSRARTARVASEPWTPSSTPVPSWSGGRS